MNNSETSTHEAKNCEMIVGTGNTEQMSLIIAFFRVQTLEKTYQGNIYLIYCLLDKEITYLCHMFQG